MAVREERTHLLAMEVVRVVMNPAELYWYCRGPGDPLWADLSADEQSRWQRADEILAKQYQSGYDDGYNYGYDVGFEAGEGSR